MKKILLLLIVFSTNAFSVDFRNFEDYKKNNALLESDIVRLEALEQGKHDPLFKEALDQLKLLQASYERLSTRLSLEKFASDALDNGWRRTADKVQALVNNCEGSEIDQAKCQDGLAQLKLFVSRSDLNASNKESILEFIDNYLSELAPLSAFDEKFISSFNENLMLVNLKIAPPKNVPDMTVKITPVDKKHKQHIPTIVQNDTKTNYFQYVYFALSLVFFAGAYSFYQKKQKINSLKAFYRRIFFVAYKSKMKARLFGELDFSGLTVINKIEKPFLESIQGLKSYAPEVHVKFKTQKNSLKMETHFLTNNSILEFVEKEAFSMKGKIEDLQQAVSACGGEIMFSNHFDIKGEITNSNLIITLPTN